MDCVTNNTFKLIKETISGVEFEFKQVEPNNKCVSDRLSILSEITNDKNSMELGLLELELKDAKGARKKEIESEIKKLESSIDMAKTTNTMKRANDVLILGTIKGNYFEQGHFIFKGENTTFDNEILDNMPPEIYTKLLKNAEDLISLKEAEEKN